MRTQFIALYLRLRQRLVHISSSDPLSQDYIEIPKKRTIVINEIESKTDKIYDLHEYVQSLATEMEAIKLFLKEEFYLLKMLKINRNTDAAKKVLLKAHICSVNRIIFYYKKTRLKML